MKIEIVHKNGRSIFSNKKGLMTLKLNDAKIKLQPLIGKPFETIFTESDLHSIRIDKGKTGKILEIALGLNNTSYRLDFEDGELKTNKCSICGLPMETMYIIQISTIIDNIIGCEKFHSTPLYNKIKNLLYVPIYKDNKVDVQKWKCLPFIHVNLEDAIYDELRSQLEQDYYDICKQIKSHIENSNDGFIHTSNGKYIQIRSKDSKPYNPIYSKIYGKNISNKNHAFYFKKEFMEEILKISSKTY